MESRLIRQLFVLFLILITFIFLLSGCGIFLNEYVPPKQNYNPYVQTIDLPFDAALDVTSTILDDFRSPPTFSIINISKWKISERDKTAKREVMIYGTVDCGTYRVYPTIFNIANKADSLFEIDLYRVSDSQTSIKIRFIGVPKKSEYWIVEDVDHLSSLNKELVLGLFDFSNKAQCISTPGEIEKRILITLNSELNSDEIKEAIAWVKAGLTLQERAEWKKIGISLSEAIQWEEKGFTVSAAAAWKNASFHLSEATDWRNAKFEPSEAKEWKEASFDLSETIKWKESKFATPAEAREWKINMLSPDEANNFRAKGYNATLARWIKGGFNPAEAAKWINSNHTYDSALAWKNAGFDYDKALAWLREGFTSQEAKENRSVGIKEALKDKVRKEEAAREAARWILYYEVDKNSRYYYDKDNIKHYPYPLQGAVSIYSKFEKNNKKMEISHVGMNCVNPAFVVLEVTEYAENGNIASYTPFGLVFSGWLPLTSLKEESPIRKLYPIACR